MNWGITGKTIDGDFGVSTTDSYSSSPVFRLPCNLHIQSAFLQFGWKDTCGDCVKVKVSGIHHFPLVHKASNSIREGSRVGQTQSGFSKRVLAVQNHVFVHHVHRCDYLSLATEVRLNSLQFPGCSFLPLLKQLQWDIFLFLHDKLILPLPGSSLMLIRLIYILKRWCFTGFLISIC